MNDIIVQMENGLHKLVWPLAVELIRGGSKPLITPDGTEDKWNITVIARSSVCDVNGNCILNNGSEIEMVEAPVRVDVADVIFDTEVQQAVGLIRSVALRLLNGTLKPVVPEQTPE